MSFGTLTTMLNTPLKLNTPTTTIINTQSGPNTPSGYHTFYINKSDNKYSFIYSPTPNRSFQTLENIIVNNSGQPLYSETLFKFFFNLNVRNSLGNDGFLLTNVFDDEKAAKEFMKDTTTKLKVDIIRISYLPDNPEGFFLVGYGY